MNAAWREARKILCVRLDSLGGVLMCTPAMRALRESLPGSRLTLLGSPAGAAASPFIPALDDAIAVEAPWMRDDCPYAGGDDAALIDRLADKLAAQRFDAAVIFTSYTQSALPAARLCQSAGIPLRLAHSRDNPGAVLSDWVDDPEPGLMVRHEVQRQLELVKRGGCGTRALGLSFAVRGADLAAAQARLLRAGIGPGQRWLLLHPGAGAAARRYPAALWAQAIRRLAVSPGLPMVLAGSDAEAALLDEIDEIRAGCGVPVHVLAGQPELGQLGALTRLATVVVANNSGPAHIAAAVGTPVVDLYALTHPQHTPWKVRNRVLFQDVPCRFCFESSCPAGHHACLAGVGPERVVAAVESLLPADLAEREAQPAASAGTTLQGAWLVQSLYFGPLCRNTPPWK
jgi:ADP-heptose:LPS heptosyltransferase